MTTALRQSADAYFKRQFGIPFDAFLAPVDDGSPAGRSLAGNGAYSAIREARRSDDATLPLGAWEHELKQADWSRVAQMASDALASKSKDLQLAAWLLESQINQTGFAGIGPCLLLMQGLCETFWDSLYPPLDGDAQDSEHRGNVIRWATQKLLPSLRQVPITAAHGAREFAWADWEHSRRNEQLRAHGADPQDIDGPDSVQLGAALHATADSVLLRLRDELAAAEEGIASFAPVLDRHFGDEGPSLKAMADLVTTIRSFLDGELRRRGIAVRRDAAADPVDSPTPTPPVDSPIVPLRQDAMQNVEAAVCLRTRADAYAQLAIIADFLQGIEPHSPTPYLLRRAIQWGGFNTAELYQELFLKLGGQIGIFDLLGLDSGNPTGTAEG